LQDDFAMWSDRRELLYHDNVNDNKVTRSWILVEHPIVSLGKKERDQWERTHKYIEKTTEEVKHV